MAVVALAKTVGSLTCAAPALVVTPGLPAIKLIPLKADHPATSPFVSPTPILPSLPTPINAFVLQQMLTTYPLQPDARELLLGFTQGFDLKFKGPRVPLRCVNLKSFTSNLQVGVQKVTTEVVAGRVAGPFRYPPFPDLHCSPLGLVPKKEPNEFRLIHHLSSPRGHSVNNGISKEDATVQYSTFDDAIELIQALGQRALMSKADIKSAFRLLPVRPEDYPLLGFQVGSQFFFDKALPMGCAISCNLFEKFSRFLHWLTVRHTTIHSIVHFLDDFLFVGPAHSQQSSQLLIGFKSICDSLGVPLAQEKTVPPTTTILFLGLEIDSVEQLIRVPPDKLAKAHHMLAKALTSRKVTLRFMQSLIGSLNFLCRAVPPGRAFLRRMIDSTMGVQAKHFMIRVTWDIKKDIQLWQSFLANYNGASIFLNNTWLSNHYLSLFTDAAAGVGCGMFFQGSWAQMRWPQSWSDRSITYKEFFPIMVACVLWGERFSGNRIMFYCDNQAVVTILNHKTTKCKLTMALVRELVLSSLSHNFHFRAHHVPGVQNTVADALSHFQMQRFHAACPRAEVHPTPIPEYLTRF